ncbi:hypothetical protein WA026_011228 [Henosepilachna vigintioctopunctata]|uniref:Uncharacterized protein n=1 Tax=Henosepilachna vigintioctopunctata TaxID=420089 RepID=A0AAW1U691_9CUCU
MVECPELNQKRWDNLGEVLERAGLFCNPKFERNSEILDFIRSCCKILVFGAEAIPAARRCYLAWNVSLCGMHSRLSTKNYISPLHYCEYTTSTRTLHLICKSYALDKGDGDDPLYTSWIYEESFERSSAFKIRGVTYRLI